MRDQKSRLFQRKTISGIKTGRQSKMLEKKTKNDKSKNVTNRWTDGRTDKWKEGLLQGQGDGWTKGRVLPLCLMYEKLT